MSRWTVRRLKYALELNDGGVWGEEPTGRDDTVVLRSTEQTLDGRWRIQDPAIRSLSEEAAATSRLEVGDLLVTKTSGSPRHIGKTTLVTKDVAELSPSFGNFMQRLRARANADPRYIWHLLNLPIVRDQFNLMSTSSTGLANLTGDIINRVEIPWWPLSKQKAIVHYLDRETAQIDTLIQEQQRLIDLLRERRANTISSAIADGIRETSRADRLRMPLRYAFSYQEGPGILASDFRDSGVPLLRISGLRTESASLTGCNFLDPEMVERKWSHFRVERGDLLISSSASMGVVSEVDGDEVVGAVPYTGIIRLKPLKMIASYIRWFVVSESFASQVRALRTGSTIQHFGPTHLSQMRVDLPSQRDQMAVAEYLQNAVAKIDLLIAEAERFIELSTERRSALITAAVTGQIDVSEAA